MGNDEIDIRSGFQVQKLKFFIPLDTVSLDPETKRRVTICNLFVNHKLTLEDIVRVLDEDYGHIVKVLLDGGLVGERRQKSEVPPSGVERRRSQTAKK